MSEWIEEELTLQEFSDKFLGNNDFKTPQEFDVSEMEILSEDEDGRPIWNPITKFIVKDEVDRYYTDGKINVSANHEFVEDGKLVNAKLHPEFEEVNEPLQIADFELGGTNTYLANGRLNHNTTPGGKALPFYSSVRLRVKSATKIKAPRNGVDEVVGIKTIVVVQKNRVGPPHRQAEFEVYFDSGIDDYGGVFNLAKKFKIVKSSGAWTKVTDVKSGEVHQVQGSNGFRELMENDPELYAQIKDQIADLYIMTYKKTTSVDTDSIEITNEEAED